MNALFGQEDESREFFWSEEMRAEISAVIVTQALNILNWLKRVSGNLRYTNTNTA